MISPASFPENEAALSPRELLIVSLASRGLTDKEIALKADLRLPTVKTYWQRARRKLDATNRAECVARFLDTNVVETIDDSDSADRIDSGAPVTLRLFEGDELSNSEPAPDAATPVSPLMTESEAASWLGTDSGGLRQYRRDGRLSCSTSTHTYVRSQVYRLARELEQEILDS